ncbi:glutathione S-transferase family protein [Pyruvatibacter sp.]|uniref:glutathione S-transferase family protein n=1 Tax=Pyruvatibacter sp. TaxID=1981328 RepID=UPI003263E66D
MTRLYEWPPTRSNRARWALEELGMAYESELVDMPAGEQNSPAYRAVHPLGVVPALATDGYTMFESVAITMQLIDEHPQCGLAPPVASAERAEYYQWSIFAAAELDTSLMLYFDNTMRPPEAMIPPGTPHNAASAEQGRHAFMNRAQVVSDVLATQPYMLGDQFSGADIAVGHSCFMATFMNLLEEFPQLVAYYKRLSARPAHQRTYAQPTG